MLQAGAYCLHCAASLWMRWSADITDSSQTLCKVSVGRVCRLSITALASSAAGAATLFLCQEMLPLPLQP